MREEDAAAAYAAALEHALLTIAAAFRRGDDDFAKRMLYLIERRIHASVSQMEAEGATRH